MARPIARTDTRREASGDWAKATRRGGAASPRSKQPRPRLVNVAAAIVATGFGLTAGLAFTATSRHQLAAPGGMALFLGNLTGMAGTYLLLVMVLLISRIPFVERVLGQDGLLQWHRKVAPWPILLIVAHVVFLTIGYAQSARSGIFKEFGTLVSTFPDMAVATAGFGIIVALGVLSIYSVRRRLRREVWWALHLFMYLALALAFAHEVVLGPSFVGHVFTQHIWSACWAAAAGLVLTYRIWIPILRSRRHRLVVDEVRPEAPGIFSIVLKGDDLHRLEVSGGQFFEWRFLVRKMWWQAHPFSISARPTPPYLRLTVKNVGDFTSALATLPVGTRVALEGPYGAFTAHAARARRVALIAGGIGVTAIHSLLEDLPKSSRPTVVCRVSMEDQLVFHNEIELLVKQRGGRLHEIVGTREEFPVERISKLVDDLKRRETFVAGPEQFVRDVVEHLKSIGVPKENIHAEVYSL
ncbi:MAG TPA: ferredoxin reductase family protein [Acidimicrobiales bacterium]|nr:ferredoxin reductase family protein [Acidimicrobiales bacterium]